MVETESFFFYTEKRDGKMEITKEKFNLLIGRKIMELRKKQCYTREELAEYVDISPKYLYEIELGRKSCSLFIGYKLSKCLEVDLDYLLQEKMSPLEKKNIDNLYHHLQSDQKEQISQILQIIYDLIENTQL